jgi:hypothetical protein
MTAPPAPGDSLLRAPYSVPLVADLDGPLSTSDSPSSRFVSEVSLCERAAGARLQVLLEAGGGSFIWKL